MEHGVRAVPVLHDLQPAVDLAAQTGAGEVVTREERAYGAAEFFEGLVGGVFGAAAGEAPQHLLGLGGAEPERGGVLHHLVVLPLDQLPADRPRQRGTDRRPPGRDVSGRYRRMLPMFFSRGSRRKFSSSVKANPTTLAPCTPLPP